MSALVGTSIPDVVLKNEGLVAQTRQNINVHVANTDIC